VRPIETVVYRNGGGASIGGLVDDAVYYLFSPFFDSSRTLVLNGDGSGVAFLDASAASGTQHRFERVQVDAVNEDNVPNIRMGGRGHRGRCGGR
jgi:hypothetical protein